MKRCDRGVRERPRRIRRRNGDGTAERGGASTTFELLTSVIQSYNRSGENTGDTE